MPKEVSDEDKALFRQTVGLVKPLDKMKTVQGSDSPKKTSGFVKRKEAEFFPPLQSGLSSAWYEEVTVESQLSWRHASLSEKRFRLLREGKCRFDDRLDLHGLSPDKAEDAFTLFMRNAIHYGFRNLLLIHGKGGRENKKPVLKNLANHWLKQIPEVLGFHSALSKDGGTGALYILLKRSRSSD